MLPTADLPTVIPSEECLAWSYDNELAIIAGEEVHLLLPRIASGEPWTHVHFEANVFTYDEWPAQKQASFADMSIGEEQAKVVVLAIAWSPPGLAKHKRSVLAVLTSNLLVSLWAPGGDPTDPDQWKRVLIINVKRIRSMAWALIQSQSVEFRSLLSAKKWGTALLAVGNDYNELSFLTVSSPYNSDSTEWKSITLGHAIIPPVQKQVHRPSLLWDELSAKHFIDLVSFGDWKSAGEIKVVYRSSGLLYQSVLAISNDPLQAVLNDSSTHQLVPQDLYSSSLKVPAFMQNAMQTIREDYGKAHHLDADGVVLKTWGAASIGGLFAVCSTSHPANMVEYQTNSESSARILFASPEGADSTQQTFPWQNAKEIDDGDVCKSIILSTLDYQLLASLILTSRDVKIVYAMICATLHASMSDRQREPCINAADSVLEILEARSSTCLDLERRALSARKEHETTTARDSEHIASESSHDPHAPRAQLLGTCLMCGSAVGLHAAHETFVDAYCLNRHLYCTYSESAFSTSLTHRNL
ncbi:hypothetical protein ACLMJK_007384 [Lecanora helva]